MSEKTVYETRPSWAFNKRPDAAISSVWLGSLKVIAFLMVGLIIHRAALAEEVFEVQITDQTQHLAKTVVSPVFEYASEYAKAVAYDAAHGIRHVASTGWTESDLKKFSQSAQDVIRTSQSLEQTRQLTERFGVSGSYNALAVGQAIAQNKELFNELGQYLSGLGIKHRATELGAQISRDFGVPLNQAVSTAGLMIMTGYADSVDPAHALAAQTLGYSLIARAVHGHQPEVFDVQKPDMAAGPQFGGVQPNVTEAMRQPMPEVNLGPTPSPDRVYQQLTEWQEELASQGRELETYFENRKKDALNNEVVTKNQTLHPAKAVGSPAFKRVYEYAENVATLGQLVLKLAFTPPFQIQMPKSLEDVRKNLEQSLNHLRQMVNRAPETFEETFEYAQRTFDQIGDYLRGIGLEYPSAKQEASGRSSQE